MLCFVTLLIIFWLSYWCYFRSCEVIKDTSTFFTKENSTAIKDDADSSGEDNDDEDATSSKSKMQRNQEMSYEDPEDEEIIPELSGENTWV